MENLIHVGAKINKEDVVNLAEGIDIVFTSAFKNHISKDNIETALNVFARTFEVKQVTITNSSFIGEDNTVTVNTSKNQHPGGDFSLKA